MAKQLSSAGIMALKEALCSVYWYKSELRGFLQLCLPSPGILNNFNWENPKRQIASEVVDCLVANPYTHFGGITKICNELCKLTDFSHLNPYDDSPQLIDKARNAVNQLKQLVESRQDIKNEEVEMAEWREQCRLASLRRQENLLNRKETEFQRLAGLATQRKNESQRLAELAAQEVEKSHFGVVYVLTNVSMLGLVKIGWTRRTAEERASELHSTGVPTAFEVAYFINHPFAEQLERVVHKELAKKRHNDGREFFKCSVAEAISTIDSAAKEVHELMGSGSGTSPQSCSTEIVTKEQTTLLSWPFHN